jgi:hypothetical protein
MFECHAVFTLADHHVRLCKTFASRVDKGAPLQGGHTTHGGIDDTNFNTLPVCPNISYREVIGCLLRLSMGTFPDITCCLSMSTLLVRS